ncbi:uncharacterized protein LOC110846786 [Folsomia candida]|uniref:uncharacterized protein LOC110846786 n=1 Tax=Folsomia candida TaxID=158441 RepID=UPI000B8F9D63|nr:uncharacterized protein LOC110845958 isoform X2 [Folsomia candida]XP_035705854.1 uncharacterized protein LOC110846786 [Folsomia candida]
MSHKAQNSLVKNRKAIPPKRGETVKIVEGTHKATLRMDTVKTRSGKPLFRFGNSKQRHTEDGWRKALQRYKKRNDHLVDLYREWRKNPSWKIPSILQHINPFKLNPKEIHRNLSEAVKDVKSVEAMEEQLKRRNNYYERTQSHRRRRYLYQVVIIDEDLIPEIPRIRGGFCPELLDWLQEHEDDRRVSVGLYTGVNSDRAEPSAYNWNKHIRSSIRHEMRKGRRAFVLHVHQERGNKHATKAAIRLLEAIIIAYIMWITPHRPDSKTSQTGKMKYRSANRHAEFEIFFDAPRKIKRHIHALAATRSIRPFHFDENCTVDHSHPDQPYSGMIHPDRNGIWEVFIDNLNEDSGEEDPIYSDYSGPEDTDSEMASGSESFYDLDLDEDEDEEDESLSPEEETFLRGLHFQKQQRGTNQCGLNAVNNFLQNPYNFYDDETMQDFANELQHAENDLLNTANPICIRQRRL